MKKFNHTGLWAMLCSTIHVNGSIMEPAAALDEFSAELHDYCRMEKDFAERTRTLRFAQSELKVAQEQIHTGAEKKCSVTGNYYSSH